MKYLKYFENKLSPLGEYFDEIIKLFRNYKDLTVKEAKWIVQEYNKKIIEEFEKGTPAVETYKEITYLIGDI